MASAPQAGIQGLHPKVWNSFKGGRVTSMNLTEMTDEMCLIASNIMFLGNRAISARPGYTLVRQYQQPIPVQSMFNFQRASDGSQFLLVQQPKYISAGDVLGKNAPQQLSNTEDPNALFSYTASDFSAYLSNGLKSYRLVDVAGVLTKYNWGIQAPTVAPTVTLSSGTLTLTYGRQYCYSWVSKITDAQGVTRVSVGPPSPISAFTGPLSSQQVDISEIEQPTDPQVNFIWIFATFDTPENSTSVFNFDAEIPAGTSTASDSSPDADLDQTRPAPFENFPAPAAQWVLQYQSRVVAIGIQGAPNWVQLSGFAEILVGIPEEAWPPDLIFKIPSGSQGLTAGTLFGNSRLMLATALNWFQLKGTSPSTFVLGDKMMEPGCAGFKLVLVTEHYMIWLGPDKRLWAWDGTYPAIPMEISKKLKIKQTGIGLSMQDLSDDQLAQCELRWYEFGEYDLVVLVASSSTAPENTKDWIQIWDASFIGDTLSDQSIATLAESDFFPSDLIVTSSLVTVNNKTFLFMGDQAGNIYRWPDGSTDNGKKFQPAWGSIWSGLSSFIGPMFHPLPPQEVEKQLFFADIQTDRQDAANTFRLLGIALASPNNQIGLIDCGLGPFINPAGLGTDPTCARAFLNNRGTSVGRWGRFVVLFPNDGNPSTLWSVAVWARPIYGGAP